MVNNPVIIKCGNDLYFFATKKPPGLFVTEMVTTEYDSPQTRTHVYRPPGKDWFMVFTSIHPDNPEGREAIRHTLQYTWDKLVEFNAATGPMPEPILGDPLDMLPK